MILLVKSKNAVDSENSELIARLFRRSGLYSRVVVTPTEEDIRSSYGVLLTEENENLAGKIKNTDDSVCTLLLSEDSGARALFCDRAVPSADKAIPAFAVAVSKKIGTGFTLSRISGFALCQSDLSAEYKGVPIALTPSEFHLLRAVALAKAPPSAADLAMLVFGNTNSASVMTAISTLNSKIRQLQRDYDIPTVTSRGSGYKLKHEKEDF